MSDGKVFTKETKDKIVQVGDDMIKLPFYAEPFDGTALRILINFIDSKADKFIPDNIDSLLNDGINAAFNKDFDEASEKIGTALNLVINIPLIEENNEQTMFVDGVRFVIRMIQNWISNKSK